MARSWAEVDLDAVRANTAALRAVAPAAELCAVVKADGYGHGAVPVARAALEAGATWLAVAQVQEVAALRAADIDADILLLGEPGGDELVDALGTGAVLTVASEAFAQRLAEAAPGRQRTVRVHLKVDTGMHRLGVGPADAPRVARLLDGASGIELEGVWTHCAVADEPARPETARQLERFGGVLDDLAAGGIEPRWRHAANSAATIAHPGARFDLVRCGIALYGIAPSPELDGSVALAPAVRWTSRISALRRVGAGEGVSYGHRFVAERDTVVATVPVGYADGVTRALGLAGQPVLIGGRPHPMAGVVTMDQVMIDLGPEGDAEVGDEVVLLGAQGDHRARPEDWAATLGTIGYEVVCGIGPRVERRYVEGERG
jgi:alanine racemase